jgi:hypothetical protein
MTQRTTRGRIAAPAAVLAAVLSLAGCGDDPYAGTGTAACPALPGDVVAEVAGDLSAGGEGYEPHQGRPEDGTLPVAEDTRDDIPYGCWWATTDGGAGLTVTVTVKDPASMQTEIGYVSRKQGLALSAPEVTGSGRAFDVEGSPQARWICGDRMLQVELDSPKDDTDPLAGAKRLAETLVPQLGCPPP